MELSYELSAREREMIWGRLTRLSLARRGGPLLVFDKPVWRVVLVLTLGFMVIDGLVETVPAVLAGEVDLMRFGDTFSILMGLLMIWLLADSLHYLVIDALRWLRAGKIWQEGLHWGKHDLTVTPEALLLRMTGFESVYRWPAFTALHKTKNMLLLTITPGSAIAVPRRAFRSPAEEAAFCDFVEARIGVVS